jgi:hypothetical protein
MPHMPVPQKPDPQAPAPQPSAGAAEFAEEARAEKVEYSVVRWCWPQAGQATVSASTERRTSFSNFVPQSSQEYSKIGMILG